MDTNPNLNDSFDELVFENRHKTYGAYQIRKNYNRSMLVSGLMVSIAMLAFFTLAFVAQPDAHAATPPDGDPPTHGSVVVTVIPDKPQETKPDKPEVTPPAKGSLPDSDPQVVNDAKPVEPKDTATGNPNGITGGSGSQPLDTMSVGCKDCLPKDTTPEVIPTVVIATDPPVFEGIDLFFSKNIKYPQIAKENGIQGTVWLSWVVNTKGELENVEVIKGCNPMLDREALRVAKLMPNWTPGKDNGKPVKFLYRKPIRFQLN